MAHYARLDSQNTVTDVVVVSNGDLLDADGREDEALGAAVCETVVGAGPWVQTSYNGKSRRRYAGVGMSYHPELDAFILPQPYPSWTLDLDDPNDWVAPVPMPTDPDHLYVWDETTQQWTAHPLPEPPPQ